jgi:hypothetical protein
MRIVGSGIIKAQARLREAGTRARDDYLRLAARRGEPIYSFSAPAIRAPQW